MMTRVGFSFVLVLLSCLQGFASSLVKTVPKRSGKRLLRSSGAEGSMPALLATSRQVPPGLTTRQEGPWTWQRCAGEDEQCSCQSGVVRFGMQQRWLVEENPQPAVASAAAANNAVAVPTVFSCAPSGFQGVDPFYRVRKECWCRLPERQPDSARSARQEVALVTVTRKPTDILTWLKYHLEYANVRHIFLVVEDTPDFQATLSQLTPASLQQRVTVWNATDDGSSAAAGFQGKDEKNRPKDDYETLQARQVAAMGRAWEAAGKFANPTLDWLMHADDDELLYLPGHESVAEALGAVPLDVKLVQLPNVEAVYRSAEVSHCFLDSQEVDMNVYKFQAYANGKPGIRVHGGDFLPSGPHSWINKDGSAPKSMHMEDVSPFGPPLLLVHYESCPFKRWEQKFYTLGNTDAANVASIPFAFYRQSIERMQRCRVDLEQRHEVLMQRVKQAPKTAVLPPPPSPADCTEGGLKTFWRSWKTRENHDLKDEDILPISIPWGKILTA